MYHIANGSLVEPANRQGENDEDSDDCRSARHSGLWLHLDRLIFSVDPFGGGAPWRPQPPFRGGAIWRLQLLFCGGAVWRPQLPFCGGDPIRRHDLFTPSH